MHHLIRTPVIVVAILLWCAVSTANATPIVGSPTGLAHPTSVITFDELGDLGGLIDSYPWSIPITTQFAPYGVSFPPAPGFSRYGFYWSGPEEDPIDRNHAGDCPSAGPVYAVGAPGFSGGCIQTGPARGLIANFTLPVNGFAFAIAAAYPVTIDALLGDTVVDTVVASGGFVGFQGIRMTGFRLTVSDDPLLNADLQMDTLQLQAVPEPSSVVLLGTGILASLGRWRRKSHPDISYKSVVQ